MPSDIAAHTRVEPFPLTHFTGRVLLFPALSFALYKTRFKSYWKATFALENPVQRRETKVPATGPHLHTAAPEPLNTSSSPKPRINCRETGGARHPGEARAAPLPLTGKLASTGLHRKQKVNMSECLFIISPEWGFSNPQRLRFRAANSPKVLCFS